MKSVSLLVLSLVYVFAAGCAPLSAATISYLEDRGRTTYDSKTGLEWLDLSFTVGQSYQNIREGWNGHTTTEGFRFATRNEVIQLFLDAGAPQMDLETGWTFPGAEVANSLFSLLGVSKKAIAPSYELTYSQIYYDPSSEPATPSPFYAPAALFSLNHTRLRDETVLRVPGIIPGENYESMEFSSALVRVAVPEPSLCSLTAVAAGWILLSPHRRKR